MDREINIHKAGGVLLNDRKFLVTRTKGKDFFIAPGGRLEFGEDTRSALIRELREELTIDIEAQELKYFGTFYAPAVGQEDKYLQMDVLIVPAWEGEITPSAEVEEIRWIDSESAKSIQLGSIFEHDVLPRLKEQGFIN